MKMEKESADAGERRAKITNRGKLYILYDTMGRWVYILCAYEIGD